MKVHSRLAGDGERRLDTVHSGDTRAGCYGKPILNRARSTDATVHGSEHRNDPLLQAVATMNEKRRPADGVEKRGGFRLGNQDVFLNIAGGLKVEDPALDLAACISVISSLENRIIPADVCFAAEVGLGGEVRAVGRNGIRSNRDLPFKV
jgi:hypothetical protein